jgi:predicted nucleic acid-binding protein
VRPFVLDNSVAMRWLLESNKSIDQKYADAVLRSFVEAAAVVPSLWHLEASNVLLSAERRGEITLAEIERFASQLEDLPVQVDSRTHSRALTHVLVLAREYKLSSYDAAYLELAVREGLSLATLDTDLIKAAKRAGVPIYLR